MASGGNPRTITALVLKGEVTATTTLPNPQFGRSVMLRGTAYPVLLPKLSDPRLHLAAVVLSLQVLGQTVLGFNLSIAQILVSLGTCALLEFSITFWQRRVIAWPASALLTGNGVAILLRVPGTEHGDYWTLHGAHIFAAIAALAILSKHAIQFRGRHLFNPANFGLAIGLLLLGSQRADPQDLWWGPLSPAIVATLDIIALGAALVTKRQGLIGVSLGFFATLALGAGVLAANGHCITARWHVGPVCGGSYWWTLMSSPEILVFMFFMITDPRTVPGGRWARVAHGVLVGALACLLIAPQTTEFATKVGILVALVLDHRLPTGHTPRSRTMATIGAVGAVALVAAVFGAGQLADESRTRPLLVASTTNIHRFPVPAGAVPKVAVDPSTKRIQPQPTATQAQQIGHDLVEATIAETAARTKGDEKLATGALFGDQLNRLHAALAGGGPDRKLTDVAYRFDRMTLILVPDLANPQAPPQLGIRATGRATTSAVTPAVNGRAARSTEVSKESFSLTFLVNDLGGRFGLRGITPAA